MASSKVSVDLATTLATKFLVSLKAVKSHLPEEGEKTTQSKFEAAKVASARAAVDLRIRALIKDLVFETFGVRFGYYLDPPIIRVVGGPDGGDSSSVLGWHRDTWFGQSLSQINFWFPLQDVTEENTLGVAKDKFCEFVKNSSSQFSFKRAADLASKKDFTSINWPEMLEELSLEGVSPVEMNFGGFVLFSGAHLHGPHVLDNSIERFSADFRIVPYAEHCAGIGAPAVDTVCTDNNISHLVLESVN